MKPLGSARTESLTGTAPGELIGTLAYMSPEQLAGGAPAESWDSWALAVMARARSGFSRRSIPSIVR